MRKIFCLLVALLVVPVGAIYAGKAKESVKSEEFTPAQIKELHHLIHNYIVNNPTVLVEASKKLQEQEAAKEQERLKAVQAHAIKYSRELFSPTAPGRVVTGNPRGAVKLAVFTQPQCSHCRMVAPILAKLLQEHPELQIITIYWPFFGDDAIYAAQVALAAQKQNKFNEVTQAMDRANEFLTKEKIDKLIATIPGLDKKKLHAAMQDKSITQGIQNNFKLAKELGIFGTPTFIFANKDNSKVVLPKLTNNISADLERTIKEVS